MRRVSLARSLALALALAACGTPHAQGSATASNVAAIAPPPLAYVAHPVLDARLAGLAIVSIAALGSGDLWVLGYSRKCDVPEYALRHRDSAGWHELAVPAPHLDGSITIPGYPPQNEAFRPTALARDPAAGLLLLGLGLTMAPDMPAVGAAEPVVLAFDGKGFVQRRELLPAIQKDQTSFMAGPEPAPPTYASGPGGRELLCLVDFCVARGLSPAFRPSEAAPAPRTAGKPEWSYFDWSSPGDGVMFPRPIAFAEETLWRLDKNGLSREGEVLLAQSPGDSRFRSLWASGADDVWAIVPGAKDETVVTHWDGKSFKRMASPLRAPQTVWGTRRDDVWLAGPEGLVHFDGATFTRVPGFPGSSSAVLDGSGSEVWISGPKDELWQVTLERPAGPAPP
jgi:hypothetical protein